MHRRILFFILLSLFCGQILAQQNLRVNNSALSVSSTGSAKTYHVNFNEPPRAITFKERAVTTSAFLTQVNTYFNIPDEFTFVEAESNTDNLGMRHRFLQQYYQGIPLEGLGYRVHERNGFVTSANGRAVRNIKLDIQTTISEEHAFQLAVGYLNTKDNVFRHGKKLIVSRNFTFAPESFSIAYQFEITVSLAERWKISISAHNGEVINKVSLVHSCFEEKQPPLPYGTGTGKTRYYGTQTIQVEKFDGGSSRMRGQTQHGGRIETYDFENVSVLALTWFFEFHKAYDFYSSNNTYNEARHQAAVSTQWASERAYEYYFQKHNRNSFDNNGAVIKSYVHVDKNYANAFWNGYILAFGDGDNNNPLVELDVVSHELTHAVTQYEAGLDYYYESGALNESFSDIFGKAVEFETFGDTATWQLGKYFREDGLRDLSNPNLKDQPDTYLGDMWYTGYDDNGGVHYNSGVQNYWFYLLCEGGNGINDHGSSYSVNAVGMDAAAKIAYRNLTEYLGPFSEYLDSRIGSLLAAADLYGENSNIYSEVDKAWDAVGVIDEPIIDNLEAYDITATTVKLRGNFYPRADTATYHFEYGTTPAYGSSSEIYGYGGSVDAIIRGLQSETKYYLRLVATNENGSTYLPLEFTTISLAPLVKIHETVDVTETTATLYGEINPNSLSTSFYFEYGTTPALGSVTTTYPFSDTTEFMKVSADVTGLQPRQTYYYKLVAFNSFASSKTPSAKFFTATKPVIISFSPTTAVIDAEVIIQGENFSPLAESNLVNFGATRATIISSSPTEIKVKVPAGASLAPISIQDAESGLIVESVQDFVPTFTDEFKKGDLRLRVGENFGLYYAVVQDMDGDGRPDIVGSHYQGFSILQNANQGGDITSESFIRNIRNVMDMYNVEMHVVDVDGNGLKDIVTRYQSGLRIFPNLSVPGFIFFGQPVEVPMGYLQNMTFNDFDMDGHVDIAGTMPFSNDSSTFVVIRNKNPKGSISTRNFEGTYVKSVSGYVLFVSIDDLNNDGASDVMISSYDTDFLSVLKNKSQPGFFDFEESVVPDPTRGRYARYAANDLNDDGRRDIISHPLNEPGSVSVFQNTSSSSNITLAAPLTVFNSGESFESRPADINGDAKADMILGTGNHTFVFLENKSEANQPLTNSSLQKLEEYGVPVPSEHSGDVTTRLLVNDLNGDGRPDVVAMYAYSYGPHDGYAFEIWQNAPGNCVDPSLVTVNVTSTTATIVLPENTTFDQYEIDYKPTTSYYWNRAYSETINVYYGYSYQIRVRAKCYLGYTPYHYIDFTADCVNTSYFYIDIVGITSATVGAYNLSSIEVQYSQAGKDEWQTLPQVFTSSTQIANLLPGTKYEVRYRGRCPSPAGYSYKEFTTLCPNLATISATDVSYNKATVTWTNSYVGTPVLEYSEDEITWTAVSATRILYPLIPGKKYYIRGKLECTDLNSNFISNSFTTPCPKVSSITMDNVTPFTARVNWVDESNTGSYTLTYAMSAGGAMTTIQTNSTYFDIEGLSAGTLYKVSVAPQCIAAKSFASTTFSTVCYSPADLVADAITYTSADLSWSDDIGGLPYSIDYSIEGSNIWKTKETSSMDISLADLRPGTTYEARVHITCLSETSPHISVKFTTELYDATSLAPNPTNGEFTIYPSRDLIGNRFSILDNTGLEVANGKLLDYTINLSELSPGIYILRISGEKPMKIFKL